MPKENAKKIIYIAYPYTHDDPVENTHSAMQIANTLVELELIPYIPHLNLLWHLVYPRPAMFWYEQDIHFLKKCDALLRMGGESGGADNEILVAQANKIPVFYSFEELKKWIARSERK